MRTLFIPVGIPGCGKSTWADALDHLVFSTDEIRAKMGDVSDQSNNDAVFAEFHQALLINLLDSGRSVVADATNLRDFARAKLRRIAVSANAATHLILFRNVEQAIARNSARDRVVPPDVMVRMIEQYERAIIDIASEPYNYITEVSAVR